MSREILEKPGVVRIVGDQCPFGPWCADAEGSALVRKPTGWMTNLLKVAKVLERRHCNLFSGGAHTMRNNERCSVRLVNAVLRALRQEVKERHQWSSMEAEHVDEPDVWLTSPEDYEEIHDAITGARLDPSVVANAEMRFLVDQLGACKYDSVDNCLKTTGKRPIPVKWVDVNRGDAQSLEVRSRLAVAETRQRTALSEATRRRSRQRLLVSFVMSPHDKDEKSRVLMFIDITRAHPLCTMRRQAWVQLLAEDPRSTEEGVCGMLLRCIYGMRDASMNFEQLTRQVMDKLGFTCGWWAPCVGKIRHLETRTLWLQKHITEKEIRPTLVPNTSTKRRCGNMLRHWVPRHDGKSELSLRATL